MMSGARTHIVLVLEFGLSGVFSHAPKWLLSLLMV
jgi:hypothetical protein